MNKQFVTAGHENRIQFFDHVRNITMFCVVLYHAVKAYSTTTPDHPVHDINPLLFSDYVRWTFDVFMMPIFFFVSGYFTLQSLKGRSLGSFLFGKIKRLGVPWITLMLSVVAFTNFGTRFKSAIKTQEIVSYGDVLISIIKRFPQVYTLDRGESHLWFLSLLLVFFVIFALFYKVFENRFSTSKTHKADRASTKSALPVLLIFGIVMSVLYFIVVMIFPKINDWIYLSYLTFEPTKIISYVGCFLLGIYSFSKNWFTNNVKLGNAGFWAVIFIFSTAGFLISGMDILVARAIPMNFSLLQLIVFAITRSFFCLSVLMLLVLLGNRYFNNSSYFSNKLSANSYHIYIVHMYIVIALQAVLVNWHNGPSSIKLIIVFLTALIISYLISEYISNRFPKICIAVLLVFSVSMIFVMNPYRYEKQFDLKQQVIKDKLSHINKENLYLRNEAIHSFKQALKIPPQGLTEAFEKLSLAYHSNENDFEIMSYLGRATVMLATYRVVKSSLEFMIYDAKGFNWLDKAVKYNPNNVNVRFNRAMASIIVPPSLDREKIAKIDFEYLEEKIHNNVSIDKSIKEQVFFELEKIHEKKRNTTMKELEKKR